MSPLDSGRTKLLLEESHRPARTAPETLTFPCNGPTGIRPLVGHSYEAIMGKGDNQRSNKEVKKPKKEVVKPSATANSGAGKQTTTIAGRQVK